VVIRLKLSLLWVRFSIASAQVMVDTFNGLLCSKSEGKPRLSRKGHILAFLNKVIFFGTKIHVGDVQELGAQNSVFSVV